MSYRIEKNDDCTIVHLVGEIDLKRSPEVREAILNTLQQRDNLLIDLTEVSYIDSSGVANLVEGFQLSRQKRLDFALVGVSDSAMSVLRLSRLDQVFPIFATQQAWQASRA
jgi:anti-sigma B factor antagonist